MPTYPQFLLTKKKVTITWYKNKRTGSYYPNGQFISNGINHIPVITKTTDAIVLKKKKDVKKSFKSGGQSFTWYDVTFQSFDDSIATQLKVLKALPNDLKRIVLRKTKKQIPKTFTLKVYIERIDKYLDPFATGIPNTEISKKSNFSTYEYFKVKPFKNLSSVKM